MLIKEDIRLFKDTCINIAEIITKNNLKNFKMMFSFHTTYESKAGKAIASFDKIILHSKTIATDSFVKEIDSEKYANIKKYINSFGNISEKVECNINPNGTLETTFYLVESQYRTLKNSWELVDSFSNIRDLKDVFMDFYDDMTLSKNLGISKSSLSLYCSASSFRRKYQNNEYISCMDYSHCRLLGSLSKNQIEELARVAGGYKELRDMSVRKLEKKLRELKNTDYRFIKITKTLDDPFSLM